MFSCLCLNPRTHGWRRYPLSNRFLGVFARNECLLPYFAVFDNKRKVHFPEVSDGGLMNCHRVSRTSGSDATLKRVVIVFLTKLVSETNRCTPLTFCCSLTKTTYGWNICCQNWNMRVFVYAVGCLVWNCFSQTCQRISGCPCPL